MGSVVQPSQLPELKQSLRGKIMVFTNGCFDLLHLGHIKYLQQSKELGDVLVVGVNSDTSTTALKGPHRPLIGEGARAETIAALGCVDYVVIFSELTAENVISVLEPQVYVKGGDYASEEDIPESKLVRSYGGKVELLTFVPGFSTSSIIESIVERYSPQKQTSQQ